MAKKNIAVIGEEPNALLDLIERAPPDVTTRTLPPMNDIIPDILGCCSTTFTAPGNHGKSTQLAYLILCVALGVPIFGRKPRKGKVLLIMGEDATDDFWRMVTLITRDDRKFVDRDDEINEQILVLNQGNVDGLPRLVQRDHNGNWSRGEWFDHIETVARTYPELAMVVLDTQSTLGMPESEGINDVAPVFHKEMNRLCYAYDFCGLSSTHVSQTKAENREIGMYTARGGTANPDNARGAIQIQRHNLDTEDDTRYPLPEDPGKQWVTRWHINKKKFSPLENKWLFAFSDHYRFTTFDYAGDDVVAEAQAKMIQRRGDAKGRETDLAVLRAIDKCVDARQEPKQTNIRAHANKSREAVSAALVRLEADNKVRSEMDAGEGKRGPKAQHYFLTDAGRSALTEKT